MDSKLSTLLRSFAAYAIAGVFLFLFAMWADTLMPEYAPGLAGHPVIFGLLVSAPYYLLCGLLGRWLLAGRSSKSVRLLYLLIPGLLAASCVVIALIDGHTTPMPYNSGSVVAETSYFIAAQTPACFTLNAVRVDPAFHEPAANIFFYCATGAFSAMLPAVFFWLGSLGNPGYLKNKANQLK